MTTIQHDSNGRINAIWQHRYPEGKPDHTLGIYLFDGDDKPIGHAQLTLEGRARLREILNQE